MEEEKINKLIAVRDGQICSLSVKLNEHLSLMQKLEDSVKAIEEENRVLKRKLIRKTEMVEQEKKDIEIIHQKINELNHVSWVSSAGYWVGNKILSGFQYFRSKK